MGQHYAVPPSMQQNVGTDTQPGAAADEAVTVDVHVAEPGGPSVASSPRAPAKNHVLQCIAHNVHWLTFVPLIIISSLQDVHILLAAILGTSICVVVLAAGFFLQCGGYTKIYPKPFDLFNIALYGSMVPLAICAYDWLLMYVGLLTNATNASFMWATIVLPCMDNFVMTSVKDRVPERIWSKPDLKRMTCLISTTWAVALTVMTAGAAIPVAAKLHPTDPSALNVVGSYVLGFAPLFLAFPVQWWLTKHYKAKMMAQYQQYLQHKAQLQQAQGTGAGATVKDVPSKGSAGAVGPPVSHVADAKV